MKPRGGAAEGAADVDAVTALRAAAKKRRIGLAHRGHGNDQLRRAREIAADDLDVPLASRVGQGLDQSTQLVLVRTAERDERHRRAGSHGGDVGEVYGQSFAREQPRRDVAGEVDILDEDVSCQYLPADDGAIVTGSREELADQGDEIGFAHRTDTIGTSGRSNVSFGYTPASRKRPDVGAGGWNMVTLYLP